jgi:hypothetical protein
MEFGDALFDDIKTTNFLERGVVLLGPTEMAEDGLPRRPKFQYVVAFEDIFNKGALFAIFYYDQSAAQDDVL